ITALFPEVARSCLKFRLRPDRGFYGSYRRKYGRPRRKAARASEIFANRPREDFLFATRGDRSVSRRARTESIPPPSTRRPCPAFSDDRYSRDVTRSRL